MKKPLKITLTLIITIIMLLGFALPLNPVGNWYQQFLPNIGSRTILDITFLDSLTGYSITTISADTSYILKTTDSGDSWSINHRAASSIFRRIQFINNDTGYIGGQHLIKTTNGGSNWLVVYPSLFSDDMHFINNDTAWAAKSESLTGGVFFTSNGGVNWQQQLNIGSLNPNHIYMYNARIGFIAEDFNYLRRTTNGGQNWNIIPGADGFLDMHFVDSLTGWKAYGFMKKTTDGGNNWITQTLPGGGQLLSSGMGKFSVLNKDTLWGVGGQIQYGGSQIRGIIFRTVDGGNNWLFQVPDTAYGNFNYYHIQFTDKYHGWAYTTIKGVHTVTGGDINWLTDIQQIGTEIPIEYKLYQNYPNPFNPRTVIRYHIAKNSFISIKIFDVTGKELIRLVDENRKPGIYEINFNGLNYSSGVFFYSMVADGVLINTKKMILIK